MSSLAAGLEALKSGKMVILIDDESRENEGDLVLAAEFATGEAVNFMASQARGLICLAMTGADIDRLGLPPMVAENRTTRKTAFTISIEARTGVTSGISAFDRARTIQVAADSASGVEDIISPGHVFPLRAVDGGVLARNGHTEGSVDLVRLAGLRPSAVICEIMKDDGTMARLPDLKIFAARHNLPIIAIRDIIRHRMRHETLVEHVSSAALPSAYAKLPLEVHAFRSLIDGQEHLAMVRGPVRNPALVRVHSECLTGDALGSLRCDCGAQLQSALRLISQSQSGVLVYLRGQEGRGIGLANKIRAYALQDHGADTVEANEQLGFAADQRDYGMAGQILKALGVQQIRLLSNNPQKAEALAAAGLEIVEQCPLEITANPQNEAYLMTKRDKLGHHLELRRAADKTAA